MSSRIRRGVRDETHVKSPRSRGRASDECPREGGGSGSATIKGMDGEGLSLPARVEVTKKYAIAYGLATKKAKGRILDQVVEVTGWNRDHARQQLRRRLAQPKGRASVTVAVIDRRRTKPRRYSYDALRVLQRVWATQVAQV